MSDKRRCPKCGAVASRVKASRIFRGEADDEAHFVNVHMRLNRVCRTCGTIRETAEMHLKLYVTDKQINEALKEAEWETPYNGDKEYVAASA